MDENKKELLEGRLVVINYFIAILGVSFILSVLLLTFGILELSAGVILGLFSLVFLLVGSIDVSNKTEKELRLYNDKNICNR